MSATAPCQIDPPPPLSVSPPADAREQSRGPLQWRQSNLSAAPPARAQAHTWHGGAGACRIKRGAGRVGQDRSAAPVGGGQAWASAVMAVIPPARIICSGLDLRASKEAPELVDPGRSLPSPDTRSASAGPSPPTFAAMFRGRSASVSIFWSPKLDDKPSKATPAHKRLHRGARTLMPHTGGWRQHARSHRREGAHGPRIAARQPPPASPDERMALGHRW